MIKVSTVYVGICGSDINHIKNNDSTIPISHMGHEIVGIVTDSSGSTVTKDDWVLVNPFVCAACHLQTNCICESYLHCNKCKSLGKHIIGGFNQEIFVPENNLLIIPKPLTDIPAMVLTDPAAVIFHSLQYLIPLNAGHLLIIGSGTLACLSAIILKSEYPFLEIDMKIKNNSRKKSLEFLEKFDIHIISDMKKLKNCFYDIVFETVGGKQIETLNLATRCINFNGQLIILGAFSSKIDSYLNFNKLFFKQINIQGVNSYCQKYNEFELAANWVMENIENLSPLITLIEKNVTPNQLMQNIITNKYKGQLKVVIHYDKINNI